MYFSTKENTPKLLNGLIRGPSSSRWEKGSIQAGMVQEELRVLHLHLEATSRIVASRQLG